MKTLKVGIIYKITYPNKKIYIGQDRTDDINYFGSADSFTIAKDFRDCVDFTVRKQIITRKRNISVIDLNILEREAIKKFNSNDPKIGYNRTGVSRKIKRQVFK